MITRYDQSINAFTGNTTIGAIITNGALTKPNANKIAMRPSHTMFEGDTIFTLATGEVATDINVVGLLAARVKELAILRAVKQALPLGGYKSYRDICVMSKKDR